MERFAKRSPGDLPRFFQTDSTFNHSARHTLQETIGVDLLGYLHSDRARAIEGFSSIVDLFYRTALAVREPLERVVFQALIPKCLVRSLSVTGVASRLSSWQKAGWKLARL